MYSLKKLSLTLLVALPTFGHATMHYNKQENSYYSLPYEGVDDEEYTILIEVFWRMVYKQTLDTNQPLTERSLARLLIKFLKYLEREHTVTATRLYDDIFEESEAVHIMLNQMITYCKILVA